MPGSHGIVLLVDDDPELMELLSDFLREEGYLVVMATNGAEALELLAQIRPFVVVTDVHMPIMDGRQLLGILHAQDAGVPIVVMTGERVQEGDASLAAAFRVIRKPLPVEELLSTLRAAQAHRAEHLPLQRLWFAAGAATRWQARVRGVLSEFFRSRSSPRVRLALVTVALACSVALFVRSRATGRA